MDTRNWRDNNADIPYAVGQGMKYFGENDPRILVTGQKERRFPGAAAFLLAGAILLAFSGSVPAEERLTHHRSFASFDEFDSCTRDGAIDVSSSPGFVTLASEEYVVHTRGNKLAGVRKDKSFADRLNFSPDLIGKKVFDLDTVEAEGAEVFIFGGKGEASLNGHPILFDDFHLHGGWSRAGIDAGFLKQGGNELVFHAGFGLVQDRETAPAKFSFLSRDGGGTWEAAQDGEFLVHLRLRRHPAEGIITSPVVDLANPDDGNIICPLQAVDMVSIECNAFTAESTGVELEARGGKTPWPDAAWTPWKSAKAIAPARYVQWRAILRTGNRARTPVLSSVAIKAETGLLADPGQQGLRVSGFTNQKIVRSSSPYGFQRPSEKLERLRREFRLDEVIAPGKDEFEQQILLRNWVRRQWVSNDRGSDKRTWDALEILTSPPGERGMCVHFAAVFTQCALALGFNARQVVLNYHFVADIWSNQHQTWVLMDVEAVYPPVGFNSYGTAHYADAGTGRPLNCLELHRACHRALDRGSKIVDEVTQLYYFDADERQHVVHEMKRSPQELSPFEYFAYPMRNDYLDRLDPWEEFHGNDNYHSNDYLWWKSAAYRGVQPQYSLGSDRAGDFYWTVNQAHLTLTATEEPGVLTVTVDTFTPNLKAFLYCTGNGKWQSIRGGGDDPDSRCATFRWELKKGGNTLLIKPVNLFDREGIVSSVAVIREAL